MDPMRRPLACLALAITVACGGESATARRGGTVIVGTPADADALLMPLVNGQQGRIVAELLFDRLAEMGPALNTIGDAGFVPRLAERWSWSADSLTVTFTLRPDARWHDGAPVHAADVVAGFTAIRDPANASPLFAATSAIAAVTVIDSLQVAFRFGARAPEQFLAATLVMPLPAHQVGAIASGALRTSEAARMPVGSGRFRLVRWEPGARIELAAVDAHYRGRPQLDRVLFSVSPDPAAAMARLKAGEIDVWDPLPPGEVASISTLPELRVVHAPGFDYGFLAFNAKARGTTSRPHPLFADAALRRALTLAVDRVAVVRAVFDTLARPGLGPFVRAQATADTTVAPLPFDRGAAEALLDSLGWQERGPDGVRRKGGRALAFTVITPSTSRVRERMAVLIQEQLRGIGIAMTIDAVDFPRFVAAQTGGDFEAIMGGLRTSPSPSGLRGSWASAAVPGGGGGNAWHYASATFDSAVVAGLGAMDLQTSRAHLRRAYARIIEDAPALWLFESRNATAVHARLVVPAWRPDAWWLTLGDWSVDPAKRLPRDVAPAAP